MEQVNKTVTFISASLNNGYDNNPEDPVSNYHLKRTAYCTNRLVEKFNANVIFVDWCSSEENKFKKYLSKNVTYIHVPDSVLLELRRDNEADMNFYEWIAKDIGAYFCATKDILFTNGDNLFPLDILKEFDSIDTKQHWYAGLRVNIESKWFSDPNLELLINESPHKFIPINECDYCNGDFTLVSKYNYDRVGGFNYSHIHAHEDTVLTNKLDALGLGRKRMTNPFFHLNHRASGRHFISSYNQINKSEIKEFILKNLTIEKL